MPLSSEHRSDTIYFIPVPVIRTFFRYPNLRQFMVTGAGYLQQLRNHSNKPRGRKKEHCAVFCLGGKGYFQTPDLSGHFSEGDVLILPRETHSGYRSDRNDPWTIYWANFDGELCPAIFEMLRVRENRVRFSMGPNPRITGIYQEILNILSRGYNLQTLSFVSSCFYNMIMYVALVDMYRTKMFKGRFSVDKIVDFMLHSLNQDIRMDDIAEEFHMSKYHLSRRFKEKTGYAPIDYFIHLKIQRAADMLLTTSQSIQEVAFCFGYDDPYYFSRIFKKVMGLSPDHYRKHTLSE